MPRPDGRANNEMRFARITPHYMKFAEGSCLIEMGETKVVCTASVEEKVPPFLKNSGKGWVTAEYSMLPRSCRERTQRETKGLGGRTMEIQRLVGRSLRGVVETSMLGERTIMMDCDVLQADGGTRTASVTGAYVALSLAVQWLLKEKLIKRNPILDMLAAISVGAVSGDELLDLCYEEDKNAAVDMNVIMTDKGRFVELQGTAEGAPFDRGRLNRLLDLAQSGIQQLLKLQKEALQLK